MWKRTRTGNGHVQGTTSSNRKRTTTVRGVVLMTETYSEVCMNSHRHGKKSKINKNYAKLHVPVLWNFPAACNMAELQRISNNKCNGYFYV